MYNDNVSWYGKVDVGKCREGREILECYVYKWSIEYIFKGS